MNHLPSEERPTISLLPRLLIVIAFLTPTLEWAAGEELKNAVKYGSLALIVSLATFAFASDRNAKASPRAIWLPAMPVIAIYAATTFTGISDISDGLQTTATLIMMIMWLTYLSSIKWSARLTSWLAYAGCAILALHLAAYPIIPKTDDGTFAGLTTQKNFLGSLCFIVYFFIRAARAQSLPGKGPPRTLYLLPLLLTLLAHSRGSLIAIIIGEVVSIAWPRLTASRTIFTLILPGLMTALLWFSYFYTLLGDYPWFTSLQDWVYANTGQNIYSGRNLVWPILFNAIGEQPWLGYGAGARPNIFLVNDNLDVTWSAHNLYLTVLMQTGFIGLAALLFFLTALWLKAFSIRREILVRTAAPFFFGICVYQTFECQLTQNNLDAGIYLWIIPAMILAGVLNTRHNDNSDPRPATTPTITRPKS